MTKLRKSDLLYIKRRVVLSGLIVVISAFIWFPMYAVKFTHYRYDFREIADRKCNMSFSTRNSHPITVLASEPCSGSLWIRTLIEQVTGIYTTSFINDEILYDEGFLGEQEEWDSGTTLLVEKHSKDVNDDEKFQAVVVLLRNPYDVFVCERSLQQSESYTSRFSPFNENLEKDGDWEEFVKRRAQQWRDSVTTWLTISRPIMVLKYEDIEDEPQRGILKMLEFMNVTVDETRLPCLQSEQSRYKLSKSPHLELYSPELRELIDQHIQAVLELLEIKGFPQNEKYSVQSSTTQEDML